MSPSVSRYQIVAPPGFSPMVGALAGMLLHSRESVLDTVKGLTAEQLSHQHDEQANPIGALLAHMAAVEWFYVAASIDARQPTGLEWGTWGPLLRLTPATWALTKGRPLEEHLERLAGVRQRTMAGLATKSDTWLAEAFPLPWTSEPANNCWAWYHVVEDELNHRGQIRWLKSRL
jgi:uncharacterized damage-inducible protein DinB